MPKLSIIIEICIFMLMLYGIDYFLGAPLERYRERKVPNIARPKIRISEFYRSNSNIDLVFLGSSHAFRSFDPDIFDKELTANSFNLGSSGQNAVASYFLLKEVYRKGHKLKLVVFETYFRALSGKNTDYPSSYNIIKHMEFSSNKLEMYIHAFDFPSSLKIFSKIFNSRTSVAIFANSIMDINYTIGDSRDTYKGKGYCESDRIASQKILRENDFKNLKFRLNGYRMDYLHKGIDLAQSNGANVLLVSAPIPQESLNGVVGYDRFIEIMQAFAQRNGVTYIDYNLVNQEEQILENVHFKDDDHMNKFGVAIMNAHLIDIIKKEDLFTVH